MSAINNMPDPPQRYSWEPEASAQGTGQVAPIHVQPEPEPYYEVNTEGDDPSQWHWSNHGKPETPLFDETQPKGSFRNPHYNPTPPEPELTPFDIEENEAWDRGPEFWEKWWEKTYNNGIPSFAEGGFDDGPVRIVGESGPELSIDLADGRTMIVPMDKIPHAAEGGVFGEKKDSQYFLDEVRRLRENAPMPPAATRVNPFATNFYQNTSPTDYSLFTDYWQSRLGIPSSHWGWQAQRRALPTVNRNQLRLGL